MPQALGIFWDLGPSQGSYLEDLVIAYPMPRVQSTELAPGSASCGARQTNQGEVTKSGYSESLDHVAQTTKCLNHVSGDLPKHVWSSLTGPSQGVGHRICFWTWGSVSGSKNRCEMSNQKQHEMT